MKILFVCMHNICRSPLAEGVAKSIFARHGMARKINVASAGIQVLRQGEAPDPRAQAIAAAAGYALHGRKSRQINLDDFCYFDLILAMDRRNLADLQRLCPPEHQHKLRLFLGDCTGTDTTEIPDPYYGSLAGFERVLALCEQGTEALLKRILQQTSDAHTAPE